MKIFVRNNCGFTIITEEHCSMRKTKERADLQSHRRRYSMHAILNQKLEVEAGLALKRCPACLSHTFNQAVNVQADRRNTFNLSYFCNENFFWRLHKKLLLGSRSYSCKVVAEFLFTVRKACFIKWKADDSFWKYEFTYLPNRQHCAATCRCLFSQFLQQNL